MAKREAPGQLELVERFVNTLEVETGVDAIATPAQLRMWLSDYGLVDRDVRVRSEDVTRAVALREALRQLLLANNGGPAALGALGELDRAAGRAGLAVRFGGGGVSLTPSRGGVTGALGSVLAIVAASMADGTWERMKACRADDCAWAFYDHTKNRSGRWCSMAVCGNRTKVRAYRARRPG